MNSKELIKALRIKSGLTQKELSKKLEISQPRLSEWENGKYSPTIKTFLMFCEKLNINPKELF